MQQRNDPMKSYMQDIGELPLISKEEEIRLAALIKQGDQKAREDLIKANLRLVVKIAHDFKGFGLPLLDLISEGNIGLMRAAEKFDPAKGAKFSSYSAWWIKQSMRRALSQKSRTIRVPVASASKINKIRSARAELADKLGRAATDEEVAQHLDFTKRTVQGLKLADLKTFSLHDPIQKGEDGSFEDIIAASGVETPDTIIEGHENLQRLRALIDRLDVRERKILGLRYGLDGARPKTLEEVSRQIGRTRERVRQIQMQALKKLRSMIEDESYDNDGHRVEPRMPEPEPIVQESAVDFEARPWLDSRLLGFQMERLFHCADGIQALNLSTRSNNGLNSVGIVVISDLAARSSRDLLKIRFFGEKCLREVEEALRKHHWSLREN
jgi:RNA polymerase primary sigma factor